MIHSLPQSRIEATLAAQGFGGLSVRVSGGVATLSGGLPDTDEALRALGAAFGLLDRPGAAWADELRPGAVTRR